jgi:hypothetical protein
VCVCVCVCMIGSKSKADSIDMTLSCKAPETGHNDWVKKQGGKTNQGAAAALSIAQHMVRKEASVVLCRSRCFLDILCIFHIF